MDRLLPGSECDVERLREFAAVQLVVADLDGTILPSTLAVTLQSQLRKLHHWGVRFTIATGRTLAGVAPLFDRLRDPSGRLMLVRGTPVILYNGGVIVDADTGQLLKRGTIDRELVDATMRCCRQQSCTVLVYYCQERALYSVGESPVAETVVGLCFRHQAFSPRVHDSNGIPVRWITEDYLRTLPPFPSAIVVAPTSADSFGLLEETLRIELGASVTRSGMQYLEIRSAGCNKGEALRWITAHLHLARDQVLAIGDNDNDVEMLQWAGIGVAVRTASHAAMASADYLARFGAFEGVVETLRLVHAARRYFRAKETRQ